jgi:CRISPR-associated protein Cmr5
MAKAEASKKSVLRDQRRALHAYEAVGSVQKAQQKDYQIAVNDLGANILRSGLCAAIASVERLGDRGNVLLGHLASAGVPGLDGATARDLAKRVRELNVDGYMIAAREMLQVATWLKRAVQATFGED